METYFVLEEWVQGGGGNPEILVREMSAEEVLDFLGETVPPRKCAESLSELSSRRPLIIKGRVIRPEVIAIEGIRVEGTADPRESDTPPAEVPTAGGPVLS